MRFFNRRENPNTLAGLFLLVLLAVFAGPTVFPEVLGNLSELIHFVEIDEGVPCARLRTGEERAIHQSLLGRSVSEGQDAPISLEVRTSGIPVNSDEAFTITIIVKNETIGTVPILVSENQLILDTTTASSGLGVVFNNAAPIPATGENVTTYPEDRIRLLGPRQTCVHRVQYVFSQLTGFTGPLTQGSTVRAFYRNSATGTAAPIAGETTIYSDQGLWTGVAESPNYVISNG